MGNLLALLLTYLQILQHMLDMEKIVNTVIPFILAIFDDWLYTCVGILWILLTILFYKHENITFAIAYIYMMPFLTITGHIPFLKDIT